MMIQMKVWKKFRINCHQVLRLWYSDNRKHEHIYLQNLISSQLLRQHQHPIPKNIVTSMYMLAMCGNETREVNWGSFIGI